MLLPTSFLLFSALVSSVPTSSSSSSQSSSTPSSSTSTFTFTSSTSPTSTKILTSKEFQWRHNLTLWNSNRQAFLDSFRFFWSSSQLEGLVESVGTAWGDVKVQQYEGLDTETGLFAKHSAGLTLRKSLTTSPTTLTVKFNFRDWGLASAIPIATADNDDDDDDLKAKVEQDIYSCYEKYGRSAKIPIKPSTPLEKFKDLKQLFKNPANWFKYTVSTSDVSIDDDDGMDELDLKPTGPPTYRYITSLPVKLKASSPKQETEVVVYGTYGSVEDAMAGINALLVESSIRVIVDDQDDVDLIRDMYRILRKVSQFQPGQCDSSHVPNIWWWEEGVKEEWNLNDEWMMKLEWNLNDEWRNLFF